MSITGQLQPASFKGAQFFVRTTNTEEGRKTVTHEYPNTDRRFVEDLGALQPVFTIDGLTHGVGQAYFSARDALLTALRSGGIGELVHPFFGTFQVVAKPFTLAQDDTELGIAKFRMVFEKSDSSIFPEKATFNTSLIERTKNLVQDSISGDILSKFKISPNFANNFTAGANLLQNVTDTFRTVSSSVTQVKDQISGFSSALNAFEGNITKNLLNPSGLVSDLNNVFDEFQNIGTTASNQFSITQKLFDFGDNFPAIIPSTLQRVERALNNDIISNAIQGNALAQAYNTTTQLVLDNVEKIDDTAAILEGQFRKVSNITELASSTIDVVKDIRTQTRQFLDNERVSAFRVAEVDTQETSTTLLAYKFYGNLDNKQKLIELNGSSNAGFVKGAQRVLTV